MAESLDDLKVAYENLRQKQGKFAGGNKFLPDVDGFDGEKHKVMKALQERLDQPSTTVNTLFKYMGEPDKRQTVRPGKLSKACEPLASEIQTMPGPAIPGGGASSTASADNGPIYFIYQWRGCHDYLWFEMNSKTSKVIKSGWHMDLE
ncbi:hypothetical protein BDF19DRAFT_415974 [Syncephalis fuscata]|nr:hypothetical protein BDF19DRAFT_415974 [Syncephalis fuscata]